MKKPGITLHDETIDEQIELILQTIPVSQNDADARLIQDLQYLLRKEQLLAHAGERLGLTNQPAMSEQPANETDRTWPDQSTLQSQPYTPIRHKRFTWPKLAAALIAAVLLLGVLLGTTQFFQTRTTNKGNSTISTVTPIVSTATSPVNTILFSDPLTQNIHKWPVDSQHFFFNGAYHIMAQKSYVRSIAAMLPENFMPDWSYTLTITQFQGDTGSAMNSFGMIFGYQTAGSLAHFYTFEITNLANGTYSLYAYNNSTTSSPWKSIWHTPASTEFHRGLNVANTVRITAQDKTLTFSVNNQVVGSVPDISLSTGQFGMIVNVPGSNVAFQNMLITRP